MECTKILVFTSCPFYFFLEKFQTCIQKIDGCDFSMMRGRKIYFNNYAIQLVPFISVCFQFTKISFFHFDLILFFELI